MKLDRKTIVIICATFVAVIALIMGTDVEPLLRVLAALIGMSG